MQIRKFLLLIVALGAISFAFSQSAFSATSITYGQTVTGSIAVAGEKDEFTFSGTNADVVTIRFAKTSGDLYPYVELFNPSGSRIADSNFGSLNATLAVTGTFKITIKDNNDTKTGDYSLSLQCTNHPGSATTLTFGQTTSGTIDSFAKIVTYKFSTSSNDTVTFRVKEISTASGYFVSYLELYDTTGACIASGYGYDSLTQKVSSTGEFCLLVTNYNRDGTGNFELTLQRTNSPANVKDLDADTIVEDSFEIVTGINVYRFTANLNEIITLCSAVKTQTSGYFDIYLELYDTTGARIADSFSGSLKHTFSSSGTFYFFISPYDSDGTGIYKLILLRRDASCYDIDLISPAVSLIQPKDGEIVEEDSNYNITWDSSDNKGVTSQEIRLSNDSGLTYPTVIASGLAGTVKSYDWAVPVDLHTVNARIKVITRDAADNQGEDANNADFVVMSTVLPQEAKNIDYEYDNLSRLTQSSFSGTPLAGYSYDALGNRLELTTGTEIPPAAPTSLTATATSSSQIDLAWTDNADNEDGFKIERGTDGANFSQIDTVSANVTTYNNTGLSEGTKYYYRVRAHNSAGDSAYSNTADATTSSSIPAVPSNLTATVVSSSQIDLAWADNSDNEEGFKIEYRTETTTFTQLATVGAEVTSFNSTGLSPGSKYYYQVRAYNSNGNSDYSNTANATTSQVAPAAPTSLTATVASSSQINLAWTDNANNEDGFKIERGTDGVNFTQVDTVGANVTNYNNTGLNTNTKYYYRVRAHNSVGNSGYSNTADATTSSTVPAAPTNLTAAAASSTQINLNWTDNSDNEDGFKIERSTSATSGFSQIDTVGANVTTYNNAGLNANTKYYYRVRAQNSAGNSSYSNTANATTLTNQAPTADTLTPNSGSSVVGQAISFDAGYSDADGIADIDIAKLHLGTTTNAIEGVRYVNGENKLYIANDSHTEWLGGIVLGTSTTIENSSFVLNCAQTTKSTLGNTLTMHWVITPKTGYAGVKNIYLRVNDNANHSTGWIQKGTWTLTAVLPAAPTNLTAAAVSSSQINLAWTDNADNEDGFKIERSTDGTNFSQINTVSANTTTYNNAGLNANTKYYYRVSAYNSVGSSGYSNTANATTNQVAPVAPTSLTATTASSSQINLSWTDNANNEDGFKIERGTDGTNFSQITTVGANVTTYNNTGLNANTKYYYRVRAHNSAGNSGYSNIVNATTTQVLPQAPTNLTATTVSASQINLAWTDNANNEDGFKIERGTDGTNFSQITTVDANVTTYNNTGLNANTKYYYRVRAHNSAGDSAYSNTANATTSQVAPAAPTNLTATAVSSSQINLSWTDNANNEDGFKIERSTDGTNFTQIGTGVANVTSYGNATGLSAGTTYYYRVRAYNTVGNSGYSNTANATTIQVPPQAPSNLTAAAVSPSQIDLAWQDNSPNEQGFKIELSFYSNSGFKEIATVGANVTTYSSTNLSPTEKYYYRVRAYNTGGNSAYSNTANATTLSNIPAAPTSLTATAVSPSQINLAWQDNSGNEQGFKIERSTSANSGFKQIVTVGANATTYANTGLSPSKKYYYRVRAYNASGNSAYSNKANATTPSNIPVAPSNLTATAVSSSRIDLAWNDNSTIEQGFKVERSTSANSGFKQIATVGADATAYSSTGLSANKKYYYRVRAYNANGNSGYSNKVNATTPSNIPAAPSNLTAAVVSSSRINLTWRDNSTIEQGFKVERSTSANSGFKQIATASANITTYASTGLSANKKYYYRVRAYNANGNSAYSNKASAKTLR